MSESEIPSKLRPSAQELNKAICREHNRIWIQLTLCCALMGLGMLAALRLMTPMRVQGPSMNPTLWEKDWILVNRQVKQPSYGEIVVVTLDSEWIVKRVMGLAGDVIDILEDGTILRNGEPVPDNAALKSFEPCDIQLPVTVPIDTLFLLGDNRTESVDSRSVQVGMVSTDQYIGTLWFVFD